MICQCQLVPIVEIKMMGMFFGCYCNCTIVLVVFRCLLKHEILLVQKKMSTDSEVLCLTVRRDFLLQDAIKEAKKKKFSPAKKLKVLMA